MREQRIFSYPFEKNLHRNTSVILYTDGILALSKPKGVLSHPNRGSNEVAASIFRLPYHSGCEAYESDSGKIYLIHRLDKETSGIILSTTNADLAVKMKRLFKEKKVVKEYLALVWNFPRQKEGRWLTHIPKSGNTRNRRFLRVKGAPNAETEFKVLEKFSNENSALLSVIPKSGKTHQIRIQAARAGSPILGDRMYGDFQANRLMAQRFGLNRMFLHAYSIEFKHPLTGKEFKAIAELPEKLVDVLGRLRQSG